MTASGDGDPWAVQRGSRPASSPKNRFRSARWLPHTAPCWNPRVNPRRSVGSKNEARSPRAAVGLGAAFTHSPIVKSVSPNSRIPDTSRWPWPRSDPGDRAGPPVVEGGAERHRPVDDRVTIVAGRVPAVDREVPLAEEAVVGAMIGLLWWCLPSLVVATDLDPRLVARHDGDVRLVPAWAVRASPDRRLDARAGRARPWPRA